MHAHFVRQTGHRTSRWRIKCGSQTQEAQRISCPQGRRVCDGLRSIQMTHTFSSSSCSSLLFSIKDTLIDSATRLVVVSSRLSGTCVRRGSRLCLMWYSCFCFILNNWSPNKSMGIPFISKCTIMECRDSAAFTSAFHPLYVNVEAMASNSTILGCVRSPSKIFCVLFIISRIILNDKSFSLASFSTL